MALSRLDKARYADGGTPTAELRLEMQRNMQTNCAVFRTNEVLAEGVKKIDDIAGRMDDLKTSDRSLVGTATLSKRLSWIT